MQSSSSVVMTAAAVSLSLISHYLYDMYFFQVDTLFMFFLEVKYQLEINKKFLKELMIHFLLMARTS
jgi:hypothetical protein